MCSGDEDRYDLERMMKLVPQDRMDAINGIEFLDLYIIDGGTESLKKFYLNRTFATHEPIEIRIFFQIIHL